MPVSFWSQVDASYGLCCDLMSKYNALGQKWVISFVSTAFIRFSTANCVRQGCSIFPVFLVEVSADDGFIQGW